MAQDTLSLTVDARKAARSVKVRVQVKNLFWVRVGMWIMQLGAWISGAQWVEEFPMSLIQPEEEEHG